MKSLSRENQADITEDFSSTSRYTDDLLNIDNIYFVVPKSIALSCVYQRLTIINKTCILDLFADDATLSSSVPSILNLTNCLNAELKNFQDWCIRNNMVVNVPKAKAMFIASRIAANTILENRPDLIDLQLAIDPTPPQGKFCTL